MRAARSASPRMTASPRRVFSSTRLRRQALRPRQDRRQRVVQLVRDAGDGMAEGRHLLGLQQLGLDVARLVVEAGGVRRRRGPRASTCRRPSSRTSRPPPSLRPTPPSRRGGAGAAGDRRPRRTCCRRPRNASAGIGVHEPLGIEGQDQPLRRLRRVAEHQLQMRIGGRGRGAAAIQGSDVEPLVCGFEEPGEGRGLVSQRRQRVHFNLSHLRFDRSGGCG